MKRNHVQTASILFFVGVVLVPVLLSLRKGPSTLRRGDEPDIMGFADRDKEMNAAMQKARDTVGDFLAILEDPQPSQSDIAIKVGFAYAGGKEYMWLTDVDYRDGFFYGTVANVPASADSVDLGDEIKIRPNRIADWMLIENGRLLGGYTMRVMRSRLSPAERDSLDDNIGFTID